MGACTSASAEGKADTVSDVYRDKSEPQPTDHKTKGVDGAGSGAAAAAAMAASGGGSRGIEEAKASMEHPMVIHNDMVFDLVCTSTPNETISCGADKTIVKYDWKAKAMNFKWTHHSKSVDKLCYAEKSKLLFSGSRDTTVRMWNLNSKVEVTSFRGHTLPVAGLAISGDNTTLCSGGRDYSVRFWDVERKEQVKMKTEPRNVVTCMTWIAGEDCILQGSEDRELRVWDARTHAVVQRLNFDGHFSLSCDVSADGLYFLTAHNGFAGAAGGGGGGGGDSKDDPNAPASASNGNATDGCMVKLWDRRKGAVVFDFVGHSEAVYDCCFLPANAQGRIRAASCSKDASIRVWDVDTSACVSTTTIRGSSTEIRCLAVSPHHRNPTVLYSGNAAGFVSVWNVKANGKLDCIAQSKMPAPGN